MSKTASFLLTLAFWAVLAIYGYWRATGACPTNAKPEACTNLQTQLWNLYLVTTSGLLVFLLGLWWSGVRKK